MSPKLIVAAFLASAAVAPAQEQEIKTSIPASTLSPDRRFGVTVPSMDHFIELGAKAPTKDPPNKLIELKTGRVVAVIEADTGWDRMNHGGVLPSRWSSDGSLLLWEVDGKWFPDALVLVKIESGEVAWQVDILKAAQLAILARTRKAVPGKYASAKKQIAGNGSAYPEGFSVDVEAINPIALPVHIRVALTSNPKRISGLVSLTSNLEAVVDSHGKFVVTKFALGRGHSRHF